MEIGTILTKLLALFTLLGNVAVVAYFVLAIVARPLHKRIVTFFSQYALSIGFFLTLTSTLGSIIYSEVVGFPACILCWIQRIFLYPMTFLFGLALMRRDRGIFPYAFLLATLGGVVALYQWLKDMLALYSDVSIPCPAVSALPSCDKIFVLEYGYITIPMMALNAFVLIGIVMYASWKIEHND